MRELPAAPHHQTDASQDKLAGFISTKQWQFQTDLIAALNERFADYESRVSTLETDVGALETDVADLDTRLTTVEGIGHFGYAVVTLSADTTLDSTYKNKLVWVDCTAASRTITLPSAASFGVGLIGFKKIDTTSQAIIIAGTLEQSQTSFAMSLEGDAGIFASDGSVWKLIAPGLATFRKNPFTAEHTVTTTSYQATREYNGYVLLCDTVTAGGAILIVLPSLSTAAFNHQTYTLWIEKFDAGADTVSIVPNGSDTLHWPGGTQIDLPNQYDTCCVWTDGARWVVLKGP